MNRQVRLSLVLLVIHKHLHRVCQQVFPLDKSVSKPAHNEAKRQSFRIAIGYVRRDNLYESQLCIWYWLSNIHSCCQNYLRILMFDSVSRLQFRAMPFEHLRPATTGIPSHNPVNAAHSFVTLPITVPASFTVGENGKDRPHSLATSLSHTLFCKSKYLTYIRLKDRFAARRLIYIRSNRLTL